MKQIPLVPLTTYNDSLYIENKKNCDGGLIILEDRIVEYYMDVQDTTAVSVDTHLLHMINDSTIQFTLIVYSTGSNVLNLDGFNVDQIQVADGKSVFTVMKGVGDANWNIQMTSSDVRPEQWLLADIYSFSSNISILWSPNNFKLTTDSWEYIGTTFSQIAPGAVPSHNYLPSNGVSNVGTIYAICAQPVWLKSIYTGISSNANDNLALFPTSMKVYGTNDGVNWSQVLNDTIDVVRGTSQNHVCNTTNYFKMFRFDFVFSSNSFSFPSVSIVGFLSEMINPGCYMMATPYMENTSISLPYCGYNIETNSSQMSSTSGSIQWLARFWSDNNTYKMTRSNSNTAWEYIYTFPDPIRTVGFTYMIRTDGVSIKLFALSYSDDKETWTEYCKVDGTLDAWTGGTYQSQRESYFYDSVTKHKYYKITIYSTTASSNELALNGLLFIKAQEGKYFNFETFIPKLNSNMQAGYMLVASSESEGNAYKMFDYNKTSYGGGQIVDGEWSLLISLPEATVAKGLQLIAPPSEYNRMPTTFSLLGSEDNDTWVTIKDFFLGTSYWGSSLQTESWEVENDTAYSYYKLVVTRTNQGSYVRIGELGLCTYPSFKGINWYEDEYVVPILSSNNQNGYVVSSDSIFNNDFQPWKAFDRNNSTSWTSRDATYTSTHWLKIFNDEGITADTISITWHGGHFGIDYTISGSNDDVTYTDLVEVTDNSNLNPFYALDELKTFKYWKITITRIQNSVTRTEIQSFNLVKRTYHIGEGE